MHRLDTGMKAIIQSGRERGFVTIQRVHAWLPDEGGDPAMVDNLIKALDAEGLDFVEDPDIPLEPEPIEEEIKEEDIKEEEMSEDEKPKSRKRKNSDDEAAATE